MKKVPTLKEIIKKHTTIVKQAAAELTKMRLQLKKLKAQEKSEKIKAKRATKKVPAKKRRVTKKK